MARNNDLVVTAGLNIDASVAQITKDLDDVAKKIPANALKIKCSVDTTNIKAIQSQLKDISKGLKLNVFSDISGKNVSNDMVKAFNDAFGMIGKMGETTKKEFNAQTKQMLQELKTTWEQGLTTGDTKPYYDALDKLGQRISDFSRGDVKLLKEAIADIRREFTDGSVVSIGSNLKRELDYLTGSDTLTRQKLDALYGSGKYTIGTGNAGYDTLFQRDEEATNAILNAANKILSYQNKIKSVGWGLDELQEVGLSVQDITDNIEDALRKIVGLPELPKTNEWVEIDVSDDIQEVNQLTSAIDAYNQAIKTAQKDTTNFKYPDIALGADTKETLTSAKSILNQFFDAEKIDGEANRVKRAIEDTEGELQRFYVQVERGDKSVETLTYALNEQGNAYEYLGKTIREADNSTAFRHEDTSFQWKKQSEDLQAFISNAEKAGAASTVLEQDIANLKAKLAQGGDTSAMNSFLDDFDIAKAKFKSFNAEVRKDNAFANLQNRIKRLTADVNAYGEANERATKSMRQMSNGKTFAVEWSRITTEMAKGADLTDRELKDLSADMAVFRKEAQAAGLAGESAFGKFANSFKVMSSYITANMVFNFVKRQLRDMVQEVTAVDTAMVELRKVTEATDEQFEAFAISAGKTGRELGASVSDVINATATFARLGESLPDAEELGKVATLYKNVGDGIDINTASEDIVSTMKAFKIEAKDAITIVDKLNEVGVYNCP